MKLFAFLHSHNTFEGQKPYEEVSLMLYRHWFVICGKLIIFAIVALMVLIGYVYGASYILVDILNFVVAIFFLVWWCALFYVITMYLLDTWIVTNHRVIDSEQHGFFNRVVSEFHLSRVQDVTVKIGGLIPTMLNYGDVIIQTAGAEQLFHFKQIPDPYVVKDIVMKLHHQYIATHPQGIEVHEVEGL